MNKAVDMGSDAVIYIPSFINIGAAIHIHIQTHKLTDSKVIS
jgi:hypothetical protein